MAQRPNISVLNPVVLREGKDNVVDFQETRCARHIQDYQEFLRPLAEELAGAAGCTLTDLSYLRESPYEDELMEDVFAVFDLTDFKSVRRKRMIRASWAPFVLFVHGDQMLSLRAVYDTAGARLAGVRLTTVTGEQITSPCRKLSTARSILLSHIHTHVVIDD